MLRRTEAEILQSRIEVLTTECGEWQRQAENRRDELRAMTAERNALRQALFDLLDSMNVMAGGDHELESYGFSEDETRRMRDLARGSD